MADQTFLTDLFDLLSPRGISKLAGKDAGDANQSLSDKLRIKLIDKTTRMAVIKKFLVAEANTKPKEGTAGEPNKSLDDIKKDFHCVTKSEGIFDMIGDGAYWRKGTKISSQSALKFDDADWLIAKDNNLRSKKCEIGIVVSKDPYLSPAVAKTEDVEMFLNYTPPLVANQLVPYLEIEMIGQKKITLSLKASDNDTPDDRRVELGKQGLYYLSTPSLLRFLVGSVDRSEATAADQAISRFGDITLTQQGDQFTGASIEAKSGMELFLSPQSLSNISTTKASTNSATGLPNGRLVDVKPFLPFASILDFEVKILNAGAGAMAHKTGKLQLKIHDKSRISEMSEFFRGPSGYGFVKIWTSYGWIAPSRIVSTGEGSKTSFNNEDAYADFINESMHAEDCWQIKNTQFGFDQAGTVNLTLDLVGLGVSKSKRTSIKLGGQYEAMIAGYEKLLQELSDLSNKYGASVLGPDARLSQILNAGASGQMLPSSIKEDPATYINQVVNHYADSGAITPKDAETIKSQLSLALDPAAAKAALSGVRATEITSLITRCTEGADPFLASPLELPPPPTDPKKKQAAAPASKKGPQPPPPPSVNKGDDESYFSKDLRGALQKFQAGNTLATKKDKGGKQEATSTSDITAPTRIAIDAGKNKIVSFGKLFINTVLPAFIEANPEIDNAESEVQVIFYALNDQCGPVSGASIAEFPIDLTRFVYAIDDLMKSKNKNDFTIEEFMRMIVNNQFSDDRSPGYGMIELFEPFNKDNPSPQSASETREGYELALARWQTKYPGFRKPLIEFMIETSPTPLPSSSVRRIDDLINNVAEPNTAGQIVRIHIYDKQVNPRKIFSEFVELSDGFHIGSFNASEVREKLKANETNRTEVQKFLSTLNGAGAADLAASIGNKGTVSGIGVGEPGKSQQPAVLNDLIKLKSPEGTSQTVIKRNPAALRDSLRALAPTILIGSQGTLVKTATLASKTDDLMAAANLVNIMKPKPGSNASSVAPPSDGLSGPGGLPLRTVPASLSIVTMGCPAARLYQQYFVDLGTGTSLDNLYNCTEVTHKLTPGKFETTLNFAFTDGYGKFSGAPSIIKLLKDASKSPPEPAKDDKKSNQPAPPAKPKTPAQNKAGQDAADKKKAGAAGETLTAEQNNTTTITIKQQ